MSKVVNMVGGGSSGGGISSNDAVLVATVPTGSTVTATKGGVALTPTIWVTAADPTLDCAIFSIPASLFDAASPWTVTATLGTDTASDTVTIDSNKEYDLELSFTLWFVKDGVLQRVAPVLNGLVEVANQQMYTLSSTGGSEGAQAAGWLINSGSVYSTLTFVFVKAGTVLPSGKSDRCGIGTGPVIGGQVAAQNATYIAYSAILPLSADFETRTISLSGVSTSGKYAQFSCDWGAAAGSRVFVIKDIYLSR